MLMLKMRPLEDLKMKIVKMLVQLLAMLLLVTAFFACGADAIGESMPQGVSGYPGISGPPGLPGEPGEPGNPGSRTSATAAPQMMEMAAPAAPAAARPAPAASQFKMESSDSAASDEAAIQFDSLDSEEGEVGSVEEFSEDQAASVASVAQNRIIVRTVHMELEVQDITDAMDLITMNAQTVGGWVVNSDRNSKHYGFISVRVPATELDDMMQKFRNIGVDVLSESSTSTDVTDEYYDLRSRVKSLQATEDALLELLNKADAVEEALEVQRELALLQAEVEAHLGRIKLLEETAAYSLVNISLNLAPQEIRVDAGGDKTFSVGELVRLRATFYPPEDISDFNFTWDFGDGTPTVIGSGSAPTTDGGRITATVNHVYGDDSDSPFIVEVKITGIGDAGIVEGSDTFIANVTKLPAIVVFAGDYLEVDEGEEVSFYGSFTRPEGLTNYEYSWEFGDGTPVVSGNIPDGATSVEVSHVYANYRPQPYSVTLTISAGSEAGEVEGSTYIEVFAYESEGFVISGWSASDNLQSAMRALSGLAQATGTALIWLAIFSPVWLILAAVVYGFVRIRRRMIDNSRRNMASYSSTSDHAEQQIEESNDASAQNDDR